VDGTPVVPYVAGAVPYEDATQLMHVHRPPVYSQRSFSGVDPTVARPNIQRFPS
jgi:hypothetical protein